MQCDSSPLITVLRAFVKKSILLRVVSTQLQLCEQFPVKVTVFLDFTLALGMTLARVIPNFVYKETLSSSLSKI